MGNIQQVLASNVRFYRKQADLTQEELAEKSGLHRTYIGGVEQQRINISLKNIEKIATALKVDPALLLMNGVIEPFGNIDVQKKPGNRRCALLVWDENGVSLKSITSDDENLTISILCALIGNGYEGSLAEAYEAAQREILSFLKERRKRTGSNARS